MFSKFSTQFGDWPRAQNSTAIWTSSTQTWQNASASLLVHITCTCIATRISCLHLAVWLGYLQNHWPTSFLNALVALYCLHRNWSKAHNDIKKWIPFCFSMPLCAPELTHTFPGCMWTVTTAIRCLPHRIELLCQSSPWKEDLRLLQGRSRWTGCSIRFGCRWEGSACNKLMIVSHY